MSACRSSVSQDREILEDGGWEPRGPDASRSDQQRPSPHSSCVRQAVPETASYPAVATAQTGGDDDGMAIVQAAQSKIRGSDT